MGYILHILILIGVYTILAISLDLLAGHTGLLSIAQAAFYGIGAYTSALATIHWGISFGAGLLLGMVIAALISLLISLPTFRLHDDYFVIATLGFQIIFFDILNNWMSLTRGPLGITGIPQPVIFGWVITSQYEFVVLVIACAGIAYFVVTQIVTSPLGRVLWAIREDEIFAQGLGKNTLRFKVIVFAVSASLSAIAGSFYAHYLAYVNPASFTFMESILVISMLIIGGAGNPWGALLGAVVLVALPEALRFMGLPSSIASHLRQLLYGFLLVGVMMVRPQGLVGRFTIGLPKSR